MKYYLERPGDVSGPGIFRDANSEMIFMRFEDINIEATQDSRLGEQ